MQAAPEYSGLTLDDISQSGRDEFAAIALAVIRRLAELGASPEMIEAAPAGSDSDWSLAVNFKSMLSSLADTKG